MVSLGARWLVGNNFCGPRYAQKFPPLCLKLAEFFCSIMAVRKNVKREVHENKIPDDALLGLATTTTPSVVSGVLNVPLDILIDCRPGIGWCRA